jgi:hypothetical protein
MGNYLTGDDWAPPPPRRPVEAQQVQWHSDAPVPPPPRSRLVRRKRLLLATAFCAALAVGLGALTVARFQDSHAPRHVVKQYFAALQSGNAADALALAATAPHGEYLTDVVLKRQLAIAPLSGLVINRLDVHGSSATASVSYRLGFSSGTKQISDTVQLSKRGSSWRLSRVAIAVHLSTAGSGAERLTFAGRPLPAEQVLVFPGAVPVTTDNAAIEEVGQPMVSLADQDGDDVGLAASITGAATARLNKSLTALLSDCLDGVSNDPNCPVPVDDRPVPGTLRGVEASGSLPVRAELGTSGDGTIELKGDVTVNGNWQDWDFNNQAVGKTGDATIELHALASISDLNTVYWAAAR